MAGGAIRMAMVAAAALLTLACLGCTAREASPTTGRQLTAEQLIAEQQARARQISEEAGLQVREQQRQAEAKQRELEDAIAEAERRRVLINQQFEAAARGLERDHAGKLDELRQRWAEMGAEVDNTVAAASRRAENALAGIRSAIDKANADAEARAQAEKLAYDAAQERLAEKQAWMARIGDVLTSPTVHTAVGTMPGGALLTPLLTLAAGWFARRQVHVASDNTWDESQRVANAARDKADTLYDEAGYREQVRAMQGLVVQLLTSGKASPEAAASLAASLTPPPAPAPAAAAGAKA